MVAGASRGCGRGIAVALGEQGATVYVTGRSIRGGPPPIDKISGTIEETAEEVTRRGGIGIPVQVDHTDPRQSKMLFERVSGRGAAGLLDYGPRGRAADDRAAFRSALRINRGDQRALLDPDKLRGNLQWDLFEHLPHYALNRLVASLAPEARKAGVTLLGLLPGFMKTERVQVHMQDEALHKLYRYDLAESPAYMGRAVVALASDPNVIAKAGQLLFVGGAAKECGFTDIDGRYIENFYRATGRM